MNNCQSPGTKYRGQNNGGSSWGGKIETLCLRFPKTTLLEFGDLWVGAQLWKLKSDGILVDSIVGKLEKIRFEEK